MNHLHLESSPYLLQHADNPVHWYPWGEEAFERARAESKPVLLSIGYSSCHWCHVMAHESFEDEVTAGLMNALYVNIKVDREEYPDIDHMYMDAVQAMTGSGGWPLNVFLTPDKKPFYGGTYFPPQRAYGRASWKEILVNVSQYYSTHRDEVEQQAEQLTKHLESSSKIGEFISRETHSEEGLPRLDTVKTRDAILSQADLEEGGFGAAPKFPSTFAIRYLLDQHALYGHEESLQHALLSLDKMRMGGLYDQLGGGFARYSTDRHWIAPHFEKMLYDNALLIEVYALAYRITGRSDYRQVIAETIGWLTREMTWTDAQGDIGFYSAQDADSEGVEGKFYTWSSDELDALLGEDSEAFKRYYNVRPAGNWEHTNILYLTGKSMEDVSPEWLSQLPEIKARLMEVRGRRIPPLTDDKILLGWNALMNKALTSAFLHTGEEMYRHMAVRNMTFLLKTFAHTDFLYLHSSRLGKTQIPAYADDLAYLADALCQLGMVTANSTYMDRVGDILLYLHQHFSAENSVLFDFTNHRYQQVGVNKRDIYDGALPSANAMICSVLMKTSFWFQRVEWQQRAHDMLQVMLSQVKSHPASFAVWANLWQVQSAGLTEVSVYGADAAQVLLTLYNNQYAPNVLYAARGEKTTNHGPEGEPGPEGETQIAICKDQVCHQPVSDINRALGLIF